MRWPQAPLQRWRSDLLQEGLLQRTPRGRVATPRAYTHLGLKPSGRQGGLL